MAPRIIRTRRVSTAALTGHHGFITARIRGLDEAAAELDQRNTEWDTQIQQRAQAAGSNLQARLQAATAAAYHRSGTGRFSRGLRVRVIQKKSSGTTLGSATIQVYATDYRETQFLTNIGNAGYFEQFPVAEYMIFAKGGTRVLGGSIVTNRLRVPRRTSLTQALLGNARLRASYPNNDRRRKEVLDTVFGDPHEASRGGGSGSGFVRFLGKTAGNAVPRNQIYFYPLHVTHPGFERDVVAEVIEDQAARLRGEMISGTVAVWSKTSRGISLRPASVSRTGGPPPSGPGRL